MGTFQCMLTRNCTQNLHEGNFNYEFLLHNSCKQSFITHEKWNKNPFVEAKRKVERDISKYVVKILD